ncbi:unnamed protein product [marine sediment metagenome]|uniref:Uncharacterized protein n=1 Tax=marine sediment metagenome TaxID=412755 RepID=X0SBN7_9ZZZZ
MSIYLWQNDTHPLPVETIGVPFRLEIQTPRIQGRGGNGILGRRILDSVYCNCHKKSCFKFLPKIRAASGNLGTIVSCDSMDRLPLPPD